jgi:hypothetical protein
MAKKSLLVAKMYLYLLQCFLDIWEADGMIDLDDLPKWAWGMVIYYF